MLFKMCSFFFFAEYAESSCDMHMHVHLDKDWEQHEQKEKTVYQTLTCQGIKAKAPGYACKPEWTSTY